MAETLDLDVLLAWGSDYQRQLEARPSGSPIHIPMDVLKQYLAAANEGLVLLKDARTTKRGGGRPKGTGMGDAVAALIAAGSHEDDAVRAIAEYRGKPTDKVRKALGRYRAKLS